MEPRLGATRFLERFKQRIARITKRNRGRPVRDIIGEPGRYAKGWLGCFRLDSLSAKVRDWDGWIRRRLRSYIWRQWKRVKTRYKSLKKLGIEAETAWMWANSRKGYWRIARSQALSMSITNEVLKRIGYDELTERYKKLTRK
ncbi:MAG: hypothetical protein LBE49_06030 [Deltaproteobacteria bacterium]|nr:hypothetical protein [Deltaproteobacteria bacterium]